MVGGLVVLVVVGGVVLAGLLALILGIAALVRINRSGGELRGRGLALAAIILGALILLTPVLLVPFFFLAPGKAEPSRAESAEPVAPPITRPRGSADGGSR